MCDTPLDLSAIRAQIDRIDDQLIALLCKRMDCSMAVAAYKQAHGLPVLHPAREAEVLAAVRTKAAAYDTQNAGYAAAAAEVYACIMETSRGLQHDSLHTGDALRRLLADAPRALIPDGQARIVCQGCAGAYSDEAAHALFPAMQDAAFVPEFTDVVRAVTAGEADYGLLPVENSTAGSVHEVYDLLMSQQVAIVGAVSLSVRHCLAALPEADPAALAAAVSHPQALKQCADYLRARGLSCTTYSNTAAAARHVAQVGDPTLCAVCSAHAAKIYGLQIVDENIQSVDGNHTRFVAISRRPVLPPDADKISVVLSIPHQTGALNRTLTRFSKAGLNLTKIESRPAHGGMFEYLFYLDFEGNLHTGGTERLLSALSEELPFFAFLGNYKELQA